MTRDEIRKVVLHNLARIAPEADLATIKPDINLREQLDLDSIDVLNFLVGLNKELKVEIPEKDYRRIATLNDCVEYLAGVRNTRS